MKRIVLLFTSLFVLVSLSAQEKIKFGDCPKELLEMTVYEPDPGATAVVIYEKADIYYRIGQTSLFDIVKEYVVRIKILSQDGVEYANASIPFVKGKTRSDDETITGLTGWTYNLVGGKVEKTKLSKDYIFTEDVTDTSKRMKFALPAVKEGSVVEYRYTFTSPYYWVLDDYVFQREIPVQYSYFSVRIPEYFTFNKEEIGYEPLNTKEKQINEALSYRGSILHCTSQEIYSEVRNLPALKNEDYVWCYGDYLARLSFEIRSMQFPGQLYRNFTNSWTKVVEDINKWDSFGRQFNNKGILKDELASLDRGENDEEHIRAVLNLVRSKVKWNERNTMRIENMNKALKEGVGTSGEINAILLNALKNAGFEAYPVAMSLRSRGRLPITHPSSDKLNYFVACVVSGNNRYFLDGTRPYTDLNVIPTNCLVEKALVVYPNTFDWADLTQIGNNAQRISMMYQFDEEGKLSGRLSQNYTGEEAFGFKSAYNRSTNEGKHIEDIEEKLQISVDNYKMEERTAPAFGFMQSFDFTKDDIQLGDEVISFNPLLFFAMKSNAFQAETRKLPIEFSYPYEQRINIAFTIPEGYSLDEAPESGRFVYEDEWIDMSYIVKEAGNTLQIAYRFSLNTPTIPAMNYNELRDFWAKMFNKENELVTIVKNK